VDEQEREQKRAELSRLALEDLDRAAGAAARARSRWRIGLSALVIVSLALLAYLTRYQVVSSNSTENVMWDRWRQRFCVVYNLEQWECYPPSSGPKPAVAP